MASKKMHLFVGYQVQFHSSLLCHKQWSFVTLYILAESRTNSKKCKGHSARPESNCKRFTTWAGIIIYIEVYTFPFKWIDWIKRYIDYRERISYMTLPKVVITILFLNYAKRKIPFGLESSSYFIVLIQGWMW